ncbi:sorbitol dehydrogenase [Elysia marginata]|uniref:Sorbitol dehydrogenase n=1 Tax=Elysia marginata TaxID=1093978 RepID=A0AAV4I5T8_9GAST|nr:sorbitol dehydrogenase [Elysia marginata]
MFMPHPPPQKMALRKMCSKVHRFLFVAGEVAPESFPAAIEAISSGKVNVKQLVSHRFPLEESEQAFTMAANKEGYKVIIDCSRPGEDQIPKSSFHHLQSSENHISRNGGI